MEDTLLQDLEQLGFSKQYTYKPAEINKKEGAPFKSDGERISEREIFSRSDMELLKKAILSLGCKLLGETHTENHREILFYYRFDESTKRIYSYVRGGSREAFWRGIAVESFGTIQAHNTIIGGGNMNPDEFIAHVQWDIENLLKEKGKTNLEF